MKHRQANVSNGAKFPRSTKLRPKPVMAGENILAVLREVKKTMTSTQTETALHTGSTTGPQIMPAASLYAAWK